MNADLSQLKDIHLPDPVSWWPPAPGWWGLFILFIMLSVICLWLYRRYQANRWRVQALAECQKISQLINGESAIPSAQHRAAQQISALLRRVAITRFPRQEVASLSGQDWTDFLTQSVHHKTNTDPAVLQTLLLSAYRPPQDDDTISALLTFAENWIKALPGKTPVKITRGSKST